MVPTAAFHTIESGGGRSASRKEEIDERIERAIDELRNSNKLKFLTIEFIWLSRILMSCQTDFGTNSKILLFLRCLSNLIRNSKRVPQNMDQRKYFTALIDPNVKFLKISNVYTIDIEICKERFDQYFISLDHFEMDLAKFKKSICQRIDNHIQNIIQSSMTSAGHLQFLTKDHDKLVLFGLYSV
ncbi:MAG: hypothetical protein MHMPM18_000336 [Marteilia pararefringens]